MANNKSVPNLKKFVCVDCKSKFKTAPALKQHCIAKNHNVSICSNCNKTFLSKPALKSHMSAKHQNKKVDNKEKVNSIDESINIKNKIRQLEEKKNTMKREIKLILNI